MMSFHISVMLGLAATAFAAEGRTDPPNVVLVFIDDMGYGEDPAPC